jgi:hypothetical protein
MRLLLLLFTVTRLVQRFIVNKTRTRALLRALFHRSILARSPLDCSVGRELPEPRVIVDNLDLLATKDALSGSLGSLRRVPPLEMDEDALELGAVIGSLGNHVNAINLAEADLTNNKRDALLGDVGKHARNAKAGTRHILSTRR